jgi:transcription-repair coupling factor (superfamily II helicase)
MDTANSRLVEKQADIFSRANSPAAQAILKRVEQGGLLSLDGIAPAAHPFLVALLHRLFPTRVIVAVTAGVKAQESFHQDVATWFKVQSSMFKVEGAQPLFYPSWDILPHEPKLPHVDVISERLETLVALAEKSDALSAQSHVVVANVVALMQKTFAPGAIGERTRVLKRGESINPLDLVEWLEDQGYEPEAQVNHKGEIALRGGILDIFAPTCPWPVRLEFFGDEVESIREFDPVSQLSKEPVESVTIPPAGELGILKRLVANAKAPLATLLEHLPAESIMVVCDPGAVAQAASDYEAQVPDGDPFFVPWRDIESSASQRTFTKVDLLDSVETFKGESSDLPPLSEETSIDDAPQNILQLELQSLDAFRPITERAVDLQIAEAQRREFFAQLHRWLRQDYAVHVFCNTEGERQRFEEVWKEMGFGESSKQVPATHLGTLSRGFIHEGAKLVVVTDAEIFGRYKVQRPRRLKSPHAATSRSALDIDFTEFEEGDFVVHVQHGIGKFLGLQIFDQGAGRKPTEKSRRTTGRSAW